MYIQYTYLYLYIPLVGPSEVVTMSGWIYSRGVLCSFKVGGEVGIFGFYNNQKKKKNGATLTRMILIILFWGGECQS